MAERLLPIEHPKGLMKIAYWFSTFKFGKVLSPLKVAYSRLPLGFSLFSNKISELDKDISLERELALLIRHKVAQINICEFCMDIGLAMAIRGKISEKKFEALHQYKINNLFSPKEKVAIEIAEQLTSQKKVDQILFQKAREFFNERQLVEIAWLISTEHYYNLMNLAFEIHSDQLCSVKK